MDELKKHIKQTKELAQEYEQEAEQLAIIKEEVFDMKVDILSSAFGMLMTKFNEAIDDWLKIIAEKGEQDKTLGDSIKDSVQKAMISISEQKAPTLEFKPQIKIDIQPIADEIAKQNSRIISLIEKIGSGGKSEELVKMLTALVNDQREFLKKGFQQFDYSKQLNEIRDGINNDKRAEKLVVKRGIHNLIDEVLIKYSK